MTARVLTFIASLLAVPGPAGADSIPPASGVWDDAGPGHALRPDSRRALLDSLIRITGIRDLTFLPDGRLQTTTARGKGGSPTAERILRHALASDAVYVIEEHSGSPAVTFGQIEGMDYFHDQTGRRAQVWLVRLDFDDFREIQASKRVRAAFDPGFVLLHEFLHAQGHRDDMSPDAMGECERILNEARRELLLPLRATYAASRVEEAGTGPDARLRFEERGNHTGLRVQHLFFRTGHWSSRMPRPEALRARHVRPRG